MNLIAGNFVGVNANLAASRNNGVGVRVEGGSGNTIGGPTEDFRNVIAGNAGDGVALVGGTSNNQVLRNLIGVVPSGGHFVRRGNLQNGVLIDGSSRNLVSGNRIGGNSGDGVAIVNTAATTSAMLNTGATGNFIQANWIGIDPTDPSGGNLGNVGSGVSITDARGNTIGGFLASDGNQIADNDRSGVLILETNPTPRTGPAPGPINNLVANNQIGIILNAAMVDPSQGNKGDGVAVLDSTSNVIRANAIFGNNNGVFVNLHNAIANGVAFAGGNRVIDNQIGLSDGSARLDLGNRSNGVGIIDAKQTVVIGNVIGLNLAAGVLVSASAPGLSSNTTITANTIGTDTRQQIMRGNGGPGIELERASNTQIGGDGGNLIAGNGSHGILIANATTGTRVEGNRIGLDQLDNSLAGVFITSSPGNTIGGTGAARNVITGNHQGGVVVVASPGVQVVNNVIGRLNDRSGHPVDPKANPGNLGDGLLVLNASGGNPVRVADNVIAGNSGNGLSVSNSVGVQTTGNTIVLNGSSGVVVSGGHENTVERNAIGTDLPSGTTSLGNLGDGIVLFNSATVRVTGNFIAANLGHGVRIDHSPAANGQIPDDGSRLQGNFIGIDPNATATAIGNALNGVFINNARGVLVGVDPASTSAGGGNTIAENRADGISRDGRTGPVDRREPALRQRRGWRPALRPDDHGRRRERRGASGTGSRTTARWASR